MSCKCGQKVVQDQEGIFCRGFCGELFHAICAKIDFPLDQLRQHEKNIYWMCDNYSELFSNGHFRNIVSRYEIDGGFLPAAIKAIQDDISKLNLSVATLSARIESNHLTPQPTTSKGFKWGDHITPTSSKRRRGNNGDLLAPVPQPKQCSGTKEICASVRTVSLQSNLFWLHLSAFHPTTTEDDISSLVRECLTIGENQQISCQTRSERP